MRERGEKGRGCWKSTYPAGIYMYGAQLHLLCIDAHLCSNRCHVSDWCILLMTTTESNCDNSNPGILYLPFLQFLAFMLCLALCFEQNCNANPLSTNGACCRKKM